MKELNLKHEAKRYGCAILAATIMALNIKTFVRAGGLFPGGFTGLTLLIQSIFQTFAGIAIPYTLTRLEYKRLIISFLVESSVYVVCLDDIYECFRVDLMNLLYQIFRFFCGNY